MSEQLDTLTLRPVHPASPVLLTKNGPLRTSIRSLSTIKLEKASYLFKVWEYVENIANPDRLIISFTW